MTEPRRPRRPVGARRDDAPESDDFARAAGTSAAKGALLVGVAVIIGIVLLQVVDPEGTSPDATGEPAATTTTTSVPGATTTTPPDDPELGPARPPAEVRVLVLNNNAPSGTAGEMKSQLEAAGWVNQPVTPTDDDPEQVRTGNAVMCREGFEAEAAALAAAVGEVTEVLEFRDPPPPESDQADCVVLVARAE